MRAQRARAIRQNACDRRTGWKGWEGIYYGSCLFARSNKVPARLTYGYPSPWLDEAALRSSSAMAFWSSLTKDATQKTTAIPAVIE